MSGWISVLGLVTAVATAITSQLTATNPRIGAWLMLGGTVASAIGGAVHKRLSLGPVATFLGVITGVVGVVAQATDVARPSIAQVIVVIGTAATASGVSLLGWESKSKNGGGGLTMSLGYVPPREDKPTIRGSKRESYRWDLHYPIYSPGRPGQSMKTLLAVLLSGSLLFSGCSQKTTLDRVGAIVLTAVNAYLIEVNQLHLGGNLSVEKYSALKANGDLAKERAEEFARELVALGEITPGNVVGLTQQVASLTGFFRQLLPDAGLDPKSKAIRILSFAIDSLDAASIVIAGIHPAAVVASNHNTGVLRPNPRSNAVTIKIPKPDREVRQALEAAHLGSTVKPPGHKHGIPGEFAEFRLQTAPQ